VSRTAAGCNYQWDIAFPDYDPVGVIAAPFAQNHVAWLKARVRSGRRVEQVDVGSASQIRPRLVGAFSIRMLAGNGRVWTGAADASRSIFPSRSVWTREAMPSENDMSIAMVLAFGPFRYFTGGDLDADTHDGAVPWLDIETPVVRMAGKVDVAVADHHGYYDADGPEFTRALDADAYVIPAWHATHPAMATVQRMLNAWPGQVPRDVYVTRLVPESRAVNARFAPLLKSTEGHVVVRIDARGDYRVFVTDSRDEDDRITLTSTVRRAKLARS